MTSKQFYWVYGGLTFVIACGASFGNADGLQKLLAFGVVAFVAFLCGCVFTEDREEKRTRR